VSTTECMNTEPAAADWRTPIPRGLKALTRGENIQDKALSKKVARYVVIREDLYKRGFSTPLLKFVDEELIEYIMNELHNDICGMHYE